MLDLAAKSRFELNAFAPLLRIGLITHTLPCLCFLSVDEIVDATDASADVGGGAEEIDRHNLVPSGVSGGGENLSLPLRWTPRSDRLAEVSSCDNER